MFCKAVCLTCVVILWAAVFMPSVGLAHAMDLEIMGEGILKVSYDGGIPARRAEVVIYDEEGNALCNGPVDGDGYFYYDEELPAYGAEAEDGLGHKAVLLFSGETRRLPRFAGGILGVFLLLSVAGGFKLFNQKRGEF